MRLTPARLAVAARMDEAVSNRIYEAVTLYNKLIADGGVPLRDETKWHSGQYDMSDLYGPTFTIEWEETWSYGGHAKGWDTLPTAILFEGWEAIVQQSADEEIKKHAKERRAKARKKKSDDRKEYERLRAKFED